VEPALAAAFESRYRTSGPIGVALGLNPSRLSSELVEAAMAGAADLGHDACIVRPGDDQSHLGVLLGIGYPDSFLPVFAASADCPRVVWVGEPLRPSGEPSGGPMLHVARSRVMDHLGFVPRSFKDAPLPGRLARARAAATLERQAAKNLRELARLARITDRVVVTSRDRRVALAEHGVNAEAVPFGYAAETAGPITPAGQGSRDLAFVFLGIVDPRVAGRRSIVSRWRAEEPRLTVLDDLWGAERGDLLRRSRIILNVGRTPGNFVGMRLVMAIAAGAVVVSEPMADPFPFVAGVHFVEAPLGGLLDAARGLCADEPRRRAIADAGQALLRGELSMDRCLARALALGA
jgi:hypothetical protein